MKIQNILDFLPDEFENILKNQLKQPSYRAGQVFEQIYKQHIFQYEEMTILPQVLRTELTKEFTLLFPVIKAKRVSKDETVKYLFELEDGICVETVFIPEGSRRTVCFSVQAGCPLDCSFCATGRGGFRRNLTTAEIIGQVLAVEQDTGTRMTNCVAMGQGEPFLNGDAVKKAIRIFHDPRCCGISARHMTISTVGIIPGILELAEFPLPVKLAVSLHSARQNIRERLIPISKKYPLDNLKKAIRRYVDATNNRVTVEYILLENINDGEADAEALLDFSRGLPVYVNLIPWNPVDKIDLPPSSPKSVRAFYKTLVTNGLEAAVRKEKGQDIAAACGQLTQQFLHV